MAKVIDEIRRCDNAISRNIDELAADRGLMSVNVINNVRNLINQVALLIHTNDLETDSRYQGPAGIEAAMNTVSSQASLSFLRVFYKQTQSSTSHYTLDEDGAERLMLKYIEVLIRIRDYLYDNYNLEILKNIHSFPLNTDDSQQKYYESIADKIDKEASNQSIPSKDNYYIHKVKPFIINAKVYYEIVFSPAIDRDNKFNRRIAFCNERVFSNYATDLRLVKSRIEVDGIRVPIEIIQSWRTNIRPCEFNNLGRILGYEVKANRAQKDYLPIMEHISKFEMSLVEIIDLDEQEFLDFVNKVKIPGYKSTIIDLVRSLRAYYLNCRIGHNVLRYLLLNMRNETIKKQYPYDTDECLSGVYLSKKTFPFEKMPYCTSLKNHNPKIYDVLLAIPSAGREHELVAKRVLINTEQNDTLFTPQDHLKDFDNLNDLVNKYNSRLPGVHENRKILKYDKHYFIKGYEDDVKQIVKHLKLLCKTGSTNYTSSVERWLNFQNRGIDDKAKIDILKSLFNSSKVALIYGAAGTGKTKMIEHITSYFVDKDRLYLANTKTAVSNLENRLHGSGEFMTVEKSIHQGKIKCSVLFIDECSTISNKNMVEILENIDFEYLVLVGDVYQIQSIRFGNWFNIIRKFISEKSVFELEGAFRTEDYNLLALWNEVRKNGPLAEEIISRQKYARRLDSSIFENLSDEEIILCLNYDGLYGVNNINRLLQSKNSESEIVWNGVVYKKGDPIVFNESDAYGQILFNNLKGRISDLAAISKTSIQFTIEIIGAKISQIQSELAGLEYLDEKSVRMTIEKRKHNDNDDTAEDSRTVVPFQVAYAATIHKAQGLEYESVKIVVTKDSEERVSKNIFYTAITRTTNNLNIYWSPEVQRKIISSFNNNLADNDLRIFMARNYHLLS